MEILSLIDALEELTIQSRRLPVGGNLVVDRKRILDLIDQLRLAVPADVRQAAQVLEAREEIVGDAHDRSRSIIEHSQRERERLLNESSILREAQERSQSLLVDAEKRARELVEHSERVADLHLSEASDAATRQLQDADAYALEVLTRLEAQLVAFLDSIRASIAILGEKR